MTDLRQSPQYARYLQSQGWLIKNTNSIYALIRKIPLTPFSIIKIQRPKKIPFAVINQLAKKYRALTVYLEPSTVKQAASAVRHGFRLKKSAFLPTKTIEIDLTQSEEKILKQMKKDCRYAIRKTCPPIHEAVDITTLHHAWKKTTGLKRWAPSLKSLKNLKKAFDSNALFLATHSINGQLLAGTVILIAGKRAYYYYAFTTKAGRCALTQYLLVWQAIKIAKKRGCKVFDFEGIYDERFPNKSWLGFSHFKKSFGGKEVQYPGCFISSKFRR